MNNHVTVLEINGKAIEHNLNYFKQKLRAETKILAVIKAFAYGTDGIQVASFLKDKVAYFAVAYTHEGVVLRKANIVTPILVLYPQIQNFDQIIRHQLEPSIYNFKTLIAFRARVEEQQVVRYPIHLTFNTGLNRLGFLKADLTEVLRAVTGSKSLKIQSLFSHLAASDDLNETEFTKKQLFDFGVILREVSKNLGYQPIRHILNTSGVINYPEAQYDMVRIGIGLYGFGNSKKETLQLKNAHTLKSIISQIHTVKQGETVGYNRSFVSKKSSRVATIPIGYADGISRKLGNGAGYITIHGQKAPVIGNVCMDMIMIDVTNINCSEGNEIFVFKTQEDLLFMASATKTISYEILTGISQRIKRSFKF